MAGSDNTTSEKSGSPVILLAVVVLIAAGAGFLFSAKDKQPATPAEGPVAAAQTSSAGTVSVTPDSGQTDKEKPGDFTSLDQYELAQLHQAGGDAVTLEPPSTRSAPVLPPVLKTAEPKTVENTEVILPELPDDMIEEINRLSSKSTDGLYEEYRADGLVHMDLQGRFQSVPIAVIGSDGEIYTFMHGDSYKPGPVEKTDKGNDSHEAH